jgi:acyl-coenzyme A thioesterase PaaI-like protein
MEANTHLQIDEELCGEAVEVGGDAATVRLETTERMTVDDHGLVHGGFVFGAADYAAMLAVNDPNVVLGGADVGFLAPVEAGQTVMAEAEVLSVEGKKHEIDARATVDGREVFNGTFTAFVLDEHVLGSREE